MAVRLAQGDHRTGTQPHGHIDRGERAGGLGVIEAVGETQALVVATLAGSVQYVVRHVRALRHPGALGNAGNAAHA